MTISILRSFTWTYLLRSLPALGLAVLFLVGGPLAFRGMLALDGLTLDPEALDPLGFVMTYLVGGGFGMLVAAYVGHQGQRRGAYVLPISTRGLAAWQMSVSALAIAGTNVLVLTLYRVWMGFEWPMLGPTLFLMALAVVAHAMYWNLLDFRYWKACLFLGLFVGVMWWLQSRYQPEGPRGPWVPWHPSVVDLLVIAGAAVASIVLGLRALGRDRHGRGRPERHFEYVTATLDGDLLGRLTRREVTPSSAEAALGWMVWARTWMLLLVAALLVSPLFLLHAVATIWFSHPLQVDKVLSTSAGTAGVCGLLLGIGTAVGLMDGGPRGERLSTHFAAMPISDRTLGRRLVFNTAWAALVMSTLSFAAALVLLAVSLAMHGPAECLVTMPENEVFRQFGYGLIPLMLVAGFGLCWTVTGVAGSLVLTGRRWLVASVVMGAVILFVSSLFVFGFLVPEPWREAASLGGMSVLAAAVALTTLLVFVLASRRRLIGGGSIAVGVAAWLAAVAGMVVMVEPWAARLIVAGLATLVAFPLAGMPLAMRWNRHR